MNLKIPEKKLFNFVQKLINTELEQLRKEAEEEWGLGEMSEIFELDSLSKIILDRIEIKGNKILAHVNLFSNDKRQDFDMVLGGVEYKMQFFLPQIELIENSIVNDWSSGFGTDW